MAGLFSKVARFARTPQGQQVVRRVQQAANDPATRRRIETGVERVRQQVSRRGGDANGSGTHGSTGTASSTEVPHTPDGPVPGRPAQR